MPAIVSFIALCLSIASLLLPASPARAHGHDAPSVRISTSLGDIVVELDRQRAPGTVANFLDYVDADFYVDTLFHRVIEGFMIQGGGFSRDFSRRETRAPITNEADNGLRNRRYTIAMARTNAPHSATAQFFINTVDNTNLDHTAATARGWGYAVFGRVVDGHDVVDRISTVATGPGGPFSRDAPREPVVILDVQRLDAEEHTDGVPAPLGPEAPAGDPVPEKTHNSGTSGSLGGGVGDGASGDTHGDDRGLVITG